MGASGALPHEFRKQDEMSLKNEIEALRERQIASIAKMSENYAALRYVEAREWSLGTMRVRAVFNPARAVSSAARTDKASIASRPCFLCHQNWLEGQEGVECCDSRYDVLVNPFPIFDRHFVIASRRHEPQAIGGRVADMWQITTELEGYTVFYNGPRCGASAPDHMHFQAVRSAELPLWEALPPAIEKATTVKATGLPIDVIVVDTTSAEEADRLINCLLPSLPADNEDEEPRFNLLATATDTGVRMIVIPRPQHRPSTFTADPTDPDGMMISPASVDVAGVIVTPRHIDFERLEENIIRKIYTETCKMPC